MALREVKAELQKMEKDGLIDHHGELYKKFKPMKEYLNFFVSLNKKDLLIEYKGLIDAAFTLRKRNKIRISKAKTALADFKKLDTSPECYAELLLYYIEQKFSYLAHINSYHNIAASDVEKGFLTALTMIDSVGMLEDYHPQVKRVIDIEPARNYYFSLSQKLGQIYHNYYTP